MKVRTDRLGFDNLMLGACIFKKYIYAKSNVVFVFRTFISLDLHGLITIDIDVDVDFGTQEKNSITSMTLLF